MLCSGSIKKVNKTLGILEKGTENKQNNNPLPLYAWKACSYCECYVLF